MGAFREHQHPRGRDGRFAVTVHPEAGMTLQDSHSAVARFDAASRRRAELQDELSTAIVDELGRFTASWFERGGTLRLGPATFDPRRLEIREARYTNGDRVPLGELGSLMSIEDPATGMSRADLVRKLPVDGSGWSGHELVSVEDEGSGTAFTVRAGRDTQRGATRTALQGALQAAGTAEEELAVAAFDVVADDAAHAFGNGTQLHFGRSSLGHLRPVAVIRPDGTRVSDTEFEQWFGAAPNGDDPYLPDACRHLQEQDSAWLARTRPVHDGGSGAVLAATVGHTA